MVLNYSGSLRTGAQTNDNHKRLEATQRHANTIKQIVKHEFPACLGVRMHDWYKVGGAFSLHLIALVWGRVEEIDKASATYILIVKDYATHYQRTTLQPTGFTSSTECATVDILAFSSRSVV